VNADQRNEIAASVAAHRDLGPGYDEAVAQGLVERIGEEIDKRVDARLGVRGTAAQPHQPPAYPPQPGFQAPAPAPVAQRRPNIAAPFIALGSIGMGLGATGIVTSHVQYGGPAAVMLLLIWAAIAVINVAYARRR